MAVWELRITAEAEDHIWRHRVTPAQLDAILEGPHLVADNRPGFAGSHRLIGRDGQGRCICAPIVETEERNVWRVITAWYCKKSEAALLRRVE